MTSQPQTTYRRSAASANDVSSVDQSRFCDADTPYRLAVSATGNLHTAAHKISVFDVL